MVEELDATRVPPVEINKTLRELGGSGQTIRILNPKGVHSLVTNVRGSLQVEVEGSVGFYTGGYMNGPTVIVKGCAGWYTGDNLIDGTIVVEKNCGSNVGPSMLGGLVLVRGSAGSRVGYAQKGGTLVVCGNAGMLVGKMMLGGRVVILGDVGKQVGESMYGGKILVGGRIAGECKSIPTGEPDASDIEAVAPLLERWGLPADLRRFTAIIPHPGKHKYIIFAPRHQLVEANQ
ncbi:MAG: glutamate synthase [Chloroflexi bacterium]|nr:glutamate synthase [Chloroflexota bacterium]